MPAPAVERGLLGGSFDPGEWLTEAFPGPKFRLSREFIL